MFRKNDRGVDVETKHRTFLNRPEIVRFLQEITEQYGIPGDKLELAVTLVAKYAYNEGHLDGMRFMMQQLKNQD